MTERSTLKVFSMLCLVTLLIQPSMYVQGQSLPDIPSDINLAGTLIHVTQQGRLQIQQEMQLLYTNPTTIHHDISVLQQLTPILKPLLNRANLPDDFRFVVLPFAEVDSVGFWALSKAQGRRLNLRMDNYVDERFHFAISTEAVLNELTRLQETQKNYTLTLLKYLQENTDARVSQLTDPIYILLGTQNSPLIWKILARKLVFEQELLNYRPTVNYLLYTYPNGEGQTLNAIAERLQIPEDRVRLFNKWLKTTYIPTNKEYSVLVQVTPEEFSKVRILATSESRSDKLRQPSSAFPVLVKLKGKSGKLRSDAVFYKINERNGVQAQNCDNVITLAFYGNITVSNFLKYNDLNAENNAVRPGEIYYLQMKAKRGKIPFHVAQKNQTLLELSNRYGIRLKSLLKYNHMTPMQKLQPGRIVWLQTKRPTSQPIEYIQLPPEDPIIARVESTKPNQDTLQIPPDEIKILPTNDSLATADDSLSSTLAAANEDTLILLDATPVANQETTKQHIVIPGQTYYAISRLYGITVNQLYSWNKLSERIPLKIGQKLIVGVSEKQRIITSKPIFKRKTYTSNQSTVPKRNAVFYTVHTGETLYRIALLNKVLVKDLVRWNDLKDYMIEAGQILVVWK